MQLQSSNPALHNETFGHFLGEEARSENATLAGVVNKTGILVGITCVAGAAGYALAPTVPWLPMAAAISSFVFLLIVGFVIRRNPAMAPAVGWIYAIIEGLFLGSITALLDNMLSGYLEGMGVTTGASATVSRVGIALPAFVITLSSVVTMLGLYRAGILKPTRRFQAVVMTLTGGIMVTYLIMFVLSIFGVSMPFLSLASAFEGGTSGLIGIGLNVLILGVAALYLIIDFGEVEAIVESGAPKSMEWYAGFTLLVTMAWIYYEAVKLVFRLAIMFANRD